MGKKLIFTDEKHGYKYLVQAVKYDHANTQRCLQCFRYVCDHAKNISWMCDDIKRQLGSCNRGGGDIIYFKHIKSKIIKP